MFGYVGKILRVNLTDRKYVLEPLPDAWRTDFLGGRGLAVRCFQEEVPPHIDPLSPDNKVVLACAPLTGTGALSAAACYVVSKSPLTGGLACARLLGHFGAELKYAGYDGIILEGAAEAPVTLSLLDDKVLCQPAPHLWGRSTQEAEALYKKNLKDDWAARETYLTLIGPAGEQCSPLATIITEGFQSQGGAGLGAVLGAKHLKAVAVRGRHSLQVADGNRLRQVIGTMLGKLNASPFTAERLRHWGSAFLAPLAVQQGILPQDNFQSNHLEKVMLLGPEALAQIFAVTSWACFACPIACLKQTRTQESGDLKGPGPTYTAIGALGANLGLTDLAVIAKANLICTELGLDPIAAGSWLATAMELADKGLPAFRELGIKVGFGEADSILHALRAVGHPQQLPAPAAGGPADLARACGAPELFMGVRGAPLAPFDPRGIQGLGLHFATSSLGPHHAWAPTFIDELLGVHQQLDPLDIAHKPELVKHYQDLIAALDSLGFCHRLLLGLKFANLVPMVNAVLGSNYKADELLLIGERLVNLERLFNLAAGLPPQGDRLPDRFLKEPLASGPAQGQLSRVPEMLPEYYRLRGWSPEGVPLAETLARLGLGT